LATVCTLLGQVLGNQTIDWPHWLP